MLRTYISGGTYTAEQLRARADLLDKEAAEARAYEPGTVVYDTSVEAGDTYIVLNRDDIYLDMSNTPSAVVPVVRIKDGEILRKLRGRLREAPSLPGVQQVGGFYRVTVPQGAKVELRYQHESGTAHFVQLRDHGLSYGIDQRGDILDTLQMERDDARKRSSPIGLKLGGGR